MHQKNDSLNYHATTVMGTFTVPPPYVKLVIHSVPDKIFFWQFLDFWSVPSIFPDSCQIADISRCCWQVVALHWLYSQWVFRMCDTHSLGHTADTHVSVAFPI